jgi:hypothetical protein
VLLQPEVRWLQTQPQSRLVAPQGLTAVELLHPEQPEVRWLQTQQQSRLVAPQGLTAVELLHPEVRWPPA